MSAELFTIPLCGGRFLIYAPLRRCAFVANASLVNLLVQIRATGTLPPAQDPDGGILAFLRTLELVDAPEEQPPQSTHTGLPEPVAVTLFLTSACNLRCTYCYASAGDAPARFMSLDVAKRGIAFVLENARRRGVSAIDVTYHGGGEPTVHWQVLTQSLAYAQEAAAAVGLEVRAYLATNGVLADRQVAWIVENLTGLSVSFDGLPSVHDKYRLTVLGQGSSPQVEKTLRRLDSAGFPYGIRVTVTKDQIACLPSSIGYICANFLPQRIQVEPSYRLGRWAQAPSAETAAFITAFRAAREVAAGHGKSIFFSAARIGIVTNHFCGLTQDLFAISPDGNVSACYEVFAENHPLAPRLFYGRPVGDGYEFDLTVLSELRRQTVEHRSFCSGCFAKWTCAGDCYGRALAVNPLGDFAGSDRCHITRELTKDLILLKLAECGGLVWHEASPAFASHSPEKEFS